MKMTYFKTCFLGKITNENSVPVFRNGLSETDTVSLSGASGPEASFSPEGTAGESA